MGFLTSVGSALREALRANWRFLSISFNDLPQERSLLATELRELIARDMAILVHKRNKWSDGDESARERWTADLEAFVARSLRPKLAGESLIALWNDVALMRTLDAMVADEQAVLARAPASLPVTCRFDSHWAN